jgi:D-alanine-D-alanine ligase
MGRGYRIAVARDNVPNGASPDALDTLAQASFVRQVLNDLKMIPFDVECTEDVRAMKASLQGIAPVAVFNLVESIGMSSRMAALAPVVYKNMGLPFTGSDESALMLTADKITAKLIMQVSGIPTPQRYVPDDPDPSAESKSWIVKSRYEHASIGLDFDAVLPVGSSHEELCAAVKRLEKDMGGACVVERYIEGREFSVAMLASQEKTMTTLPVAEMQFNDFASDPKILNYASKWVDESAPALNTRRCFDIPAADREKMQLMQDLAEQCWKIFGLAGYARVDFRTDEAGNPFVIDINPNPCIAEDSGFMAAARAGGLSSQDVIKRILDAGLNLSAG